MWYGKELVPKAAEPKNHAPLNLVDLNISYLESAP